MKRKFGVWAGVRSSSSREYLRDRKIHFLELDFAHPNELRHNSRDIKDLQ